MVAKGYKQVCYKWTNMRELCGDGNVLDYITAHQVHLDHIKVNILVVVLSFTKILYWGNWVKSSKDFSVLLPLDVNV